MIELLEETATPRSNLAIIWADSPGLEALALRDSLRLKGHKAVIRDACFYASNSVEPASHLVFMNAVKRDEIIRDYRSEGYRRIYGDVEVIDADSDSAGAPIAAALMGAPNDQKSAEDGPDALAAQLESMSRDDLAKYVEAITGTRQHHRASRETILNNLRAHMAGQPPPSDGPDQEPAGDATA